MPNDEMPLKIRRGGVEDVEVVAPLFDAYRQFYEQASDVAGARAFLRERLTKSESVLFVAQIGGEVVGFTQLYPVFTSVGMRPIWRLNDLYVKQDRRQLGAGEALMNAALEFAKQSGAKRVELETEITNAPARALYDGLGMKMGTKFVKYTIDVN